MMKNRIIKKVLSLTLCVSFLLSINTFVTNAETHWANEAANKLINMGVVSGYSDGSLKLDNTITRAEFAKIINKALGLTKKANVNFHDVTNDKWYYNEMLIAKGEGYMMGDDLGNSNPEASITRAETAVIVARVLSLYPKEHASFYDWNDIPDWAKDC